MKKSMLVLAIASLVAGNASAVSVSDSGSATSTSYAQGGLVNVWGTANSASGVALAAPGTSTLNLSQASGSYSALGFGLAAGGAQVATLAAGQIVPGTTAGIAETHETSGAGVWLGNSAATIGSTSFSGANIGPAINATSHSSELSVQFDTGFSSIVNVSGLSGAGATVTH